MAGDWIKMRNNLWDDPRVSRLCDLTGHSEAAVVGGLYWLWSAADEHSETGDMPGLSTRGIDRKTGLQGLGDALVTIQWIAEKDGGIVILNFEEHNGASAKRRAMEAQRKANSRKVSASQADKAQTENGQGRTDCGAREEKRREEDNPPVVPPAGGRKKADRGSRLPEDWALPSAWRDWAKAKTPGLDIEREAEKFHNHWLAASGSGASKKDWQATWRNWCLKAEEMQGKRGGQSDDPFREAI